ncbi:MAG: Recombination inhibitory protein MutS2 [Myxococcaceae bacterium]|nr:Recombination inhibitory protein MutS2 [Myxococcaceae bacterium]
MSDLAPDQALLAKTLADLEWHRLELEVGKQLRSSFSGSGLGAFELPLASSFEGTEQALAETSEALAQLVAGEPLPLDGIRNIGQHLLRVERHGDLEVGPLNEVRVTLAAARVLRKYLAARRAVLPALSAACPIDPTLDRLTATLDEAFDPEGTLADHASGELKRLRTETRNLRGHLVSRLEELIHQHSELLSDRFYTLRDGRYVLPVRSDTHERVHGIVHGASSSGSTIFVEPRALVLPGNRLKLAEAEQEREETRILGALSSELRDELPSVRAAFEALLHADLRSACARLTRQLSLTRPVLLREPRVRLRGAKHPVLLLDGIAVVPNDVDAEAGRALVISGPNAGGKTVALKLLGLSALMVRAGLFLPADEGSECGFFGAVLSDIGDEQSLEKSLSTFSAHIDHMRRILEVAQRGALVLLDELAGSTDPEEGAALACAIVERLCELGAAVAVTTHYEPLKARALSDTRLRNASVGFDVASMSPTFRLRLDLPGASSALAVAERFGLAPGIIARARSIVPEQSKHFDQLVKQLETRLSEVERQSVQVQDELRRARDLRTQAETELERQVARDKKALGVEAQRVMEELRSARGDLDKAKKQLRKQKLDHDEVREAQQKIEQIAAKGVLEQTQRRADDDRADVSPEQLTVGARVYVPRLRAEVEIVELPNKGKLRVAAGAMRLWVDVSELRASAPREEERPRVSIGRATSARPLTRTVDNTVVLRGMRVDDALTLLETSLDRLYGRDENIAFIDHGVGSGALRDAVRSFLERPSAYVASARPGTAEEGGERMTVVLLR